MKMNDNWLIQNLQLTYASDEQNIWLENSKSLRKLIGILGILLPFLLWFWLMWTDDQLAVLESISHYYYTRANGIFIIVVSLVAIFLIVYKGKEPIDFFLSLLAGLGALLLLLFPTTSILSACPDDPNYPYYYSILQYSNSRIWLHYISAGLFLSSLAIMSLFLFTKSNKPIAERGVRKRWRNRIYRICGIGMICALIVIGLGGLEVISKTWYESHQMTFWMEALAVELFGISWLVKGETLLQD